MNLIDLLSLLRQQEIQLYLEGDKLRIKAPYGVVNDTIKSHLKSYKEEIIALIQSSQLKVEDTFVIPADRSTFLPLSISQQSLWMLDRLHPESTAYNMSAVYKFTGNLNFSIVNKTITEILSRHDVFRTRIVEDDTGNPQLIIDLPTEFHATEHELHIEPGSDIQRETHRFLNNLTQHPFDLQKGPLYRFDIVRVSGIEEQQFILVICLHHIISDGYSLNLLMRELIMLFTAFVQNAPSPLIPVTFQYSDFAVWQRRKFSGEALERELSFWRNELHGVSPYLALPTDRPRPSIQSAKGAKYQFAFPDEIYQALERFCRSDGITLFMGLHTALQVVLARHANQYDFCIAVPTAGRDRRELANLMGFVANALFVRADLHGNPTWQELLRRVKKNILASFSHQDIPAQLILDHLAINRKLSYQPLAQVAFQLQNFSGIIQSNAEESQLLNAFSETTQLRVEPIHLNDIEAKSDLVFIAVQNPQKLSCTIEYNVELFEITTIVRLVEHWISAIRSLLEHPDGRIEDFPLEPLSQFHQFLGVKDGEVLHPVNLNQIAFLKDLQLRPETKQYALGLCIALPFRLNTTLLREAIYRVNMTHASLRARYVVCDLPWADPFYQIIQVEDPAQVEEIQLSGIENPELYLQNHFEQWCYRRCDVFSEALLRLQIVSTAEDQFWLLLSFHHILMDGIAGVNYLHKVLDCYQNLIEGNDIDFKETSFPSHIFQNRRESDTPSTLVYWREKALTVAAINSTSITQQNHDNNYQIIGRDISTELWTAIETYCRRHKTHPSVFFRLLSALLIKQYCNPEQDFILYDIQSGRSTAQSEELGIYYQQVPYIIPLSSLADTSTVSDFFKQQRIYRKSIREVLPLSLAAQNHIFPKGNVSFQYNYFNFLTEIDVCGTRQRPIAASSRVDGTVQIFVKDFGSNLRLELWYDGTVFIPLQFLERMEMLALQLTKNEDQRFGNLDYLLHAEHTTLSRYSQTAPSPYVHYSLVEWFETSVARFPHNIAVIDGDVQLSYRKLNQSANQLAHYLLNLGLKKGEHVGICLHRSAQWLVAVWAVIKAGGVYVPIEPTYPQERINFILSDCTARFLLTETSNSILIPSSVEILINLDSTKESIASCKTDNLEEKPGSSDIFYVIYTSGSTGRPKGAMVTHDNVLNLLHWYTSAAQFDQNQKSIVISPFGFDLTQKNLFSPLLCGGTVVLPKMQAFDATVVAMEIARTGATHINCAPSVLYALVESCDEARFEQLKTLQKVFLGGETIRLELLQNWLRHPQCKANIFNSYGPTECTDVATYALIDQASTISGTMIGRPIPNVWVYLLNDALKPVALGATGEIFIGGAGVGAGYFNQEMISHETFVTVQGIPGRLYRTGDLGRFLSDGSIEYRGRKDFQFKFRGYRIEPAEIEYAIKQLPYVKDALVVLSQERLIAYMLCDDHSCVADGISLLREKLPNHMIPSRLIPLAKWPLTPNGKIDRKSLPKPDEQSKSWRFVEPRNELEVSIADIWSQVLQRQRISVEDNFYDLGGHSLIANQIIVRIRKIFGVTLSIRELINHPTIEKLAKLISRLDKTHQEVPLFSVDRGARIPLSIAQYRLWLLDKIEPGSTAYNLPMIMRITGSLKITALESALSAVLNRHEALRTVFLEDDAGAYQSILAEKRWALPITRINADSPAEQETEVQRMLSIILMETFVLYEGPLFRTHLYQLAEQEFIVAVVMHHIVTDGWSIAILARDLLNAYTQLVNEGRIEWHSLAFQYADFSVWQRSRIDSAETEKSLAYWKERLSSLSPLELPTDYKRPAKQTFTGKTLHFELGKEVKTCLNKLAQDESSTAFLTLFSTYAILLQRYSGQDDICIGTPVAGRDLLELENMVGFFVNTLSIKLDLETCVSFRDVLRHVRQRVNEGFAHQAVPFEQVVEAVNPERDMSRSPLFQVTFAYQNLPINQLLVNNLPTSNDIRLTPYSTDIEAVKYDLSLTLWDTESGFGGSLQYNLALFSESTAETLVSHFRTLIESLAAAPDLPLYRHSYLSRQEISQQLIDWNQTKREYDAAIGIHQWVDQSTEVHKHAIAVRYDQFSLSFQQLFERSNQFAHYLISKGIKPDDRIALCFDRCLELIPVILGIVKAGAIFVPLDPSYPEERLRFNIESIAVRNGVTRSHLMTNLPMSTNWIILDEIAEDLLHYDTQPPAIPHDPMRLLYIIFTSGSTGKPKATGAYHHAYINMLQWYIRQSNMCSDDRTLPISSLGFDLTYKNIFGPLVVGGTIVIPHFQEFDAGEINQLIAREAITWINCTPSAFYSLQDEAWQWPTLRTLKHLSLGGEPINLVRLAPWLRQSNCQLFNSYGPTECTDISASFPIVLERDLNLPVLPIGRPNDNVRLYVLGKHQELLPVGAVGELYIGGIGVGPGYLNNPEQSAKAFISDPYVQGETIYRSGDRVRYRNDGAIEFLGRCDHQMKLRGYRLEAGEIEAVLNQIQGVKNSIVAAIKNDQGIQQLVAWVLCDDPSLIETHTLDKCARKFLPSFMIPDHFILMSQFPLSPNGKVDRKALPRPEKQERTDFLHPRTTLENRLREMWCSVLGLERIGIRDNFFESGGQSLLAAILANRISHEMQRKATVRMLFENPTIETLAQALDESTDSTNIPMIRPRHIKSPARLSFGQQRLWLFEQIFPHNASHNMPVSLHIRGELDHSSLESACQELIRRHEAMRTGFSVNAQGIPQQNIFENAEWTLGYYDLSDFQESVRAKRLAEITEKVHSEPFNLQNPPLFRAMLIKINSVPEYHFLICMHHIISDGASITLLVRELANLYVGFQASLPTSLPELPLQYADFAEWQRDWISPEKIQQQLHYWQQKLAKAPEFLDLPLDNARPLVQSTKGKNEVISFPQEFVHQLKHYCSVNRITPFIFMLAAWKVLLSRYAHQTDIVVGIPTLGRNATELESIVGFFVQSMVLRTDLSNNPRISEVLNRVKETVLDGFSHGDVPVDMIVEHLGIKRNPAYTPLVQVAFQLLDSKQDNDLDLQPHFNIDNLEITVNHSTTQTAKFDLTLSLCLHENVLSGTLEFNSTIFEVSTAKRLLKHYQYLSQQMLSLADQPINTIAFSNVDQLLPELEITNEVYESVWPLTAMQRDMMIDSLVNPHTLQNSLGFAQAVHRPLDIARWQQCLQDFANSQPLLRAHLVAGNKPWHDELYIAILRQSPITWKFIDWTQQNKSEEEALQFLQDTVIHRPYDVFNDPLIRFGALKITENHFILFISTHHALLDGIGIKNLWVQVTEHYQHLIMGEKHSYQPDRFREFVALARQFQDTDEILAFWKQQLATVEPLDFSATAPDIHDSKPVIRIHTIAKEHAQSIKKYCRQHRITPALYFKCLLGLMIKVYCRTQTDFSIQTTEAGRPKGHKTTLGCYIQEIPFVFEESVLNPESNFTNLLEYARRYQKLTKPWRGISISKQLELSPRGRLGFMYNYYDFLIDQVFLGERMTPDGVHSDPANNVQFIVTELSEGFRLRLHFHPHLFTDADFLKRIEFISRQIIEGRQKHLGDLQFVSEPAELNLLMRTWNDNVRHYDLSHCLHQKFENQTTCTPEAIAVVDDNQSYDYKTLNSRANQLARYLRRIGIKQGDLVGLYSERNADFLVGILGIMKAGAAYVPMDPSYPEDRINYMRDHSGVKVLLTQHCLLDKLVDRMQTILTCLDSDWPTISREFDENLNLSYMPQDLAYMIYTSGSTGTPKGVLLRHDGALNHIEAERELLGLKGAFNFLQTAPCSSDISVWQFLAPILCGGCVVVMDTVTNIPKMFDLVQQHDVNVLELVPAALHLFIEHASQQQDTRDIPSLRCMMVTGETVPVALANNWLNLFPYIPLINAYGPTEASDDVIQCAITRPISASQRSVPIGKPLPNLEVFIVDEVMRLVPAGIIGEICIGGIGVGNGYWEDPETTASSFVTNPFPGARSPTLYRTGDLGRWLSDGQIELVGRTTHQVKIRGFRIELNEVTAALSALPGVRECAVVMRDDLPGDPILAAYVVPDRQITGLDGAQLRRELKNRLPDFMLPTAWVMLDKLPITAAGKIDRQALPRPEMLRQGEIEYTPARTQLESTLVEIWQTFLPVDVVGVHDNFFDLGGHSLIAVRLMARINQILGTKFQVSTLFITQTVESLAQQIECGETVDSCLASLAQNDMPPVFLIHPVGGEVTIYRELVEALRPHFSIYGLRNRGLNNDSMFETLERMVAHYVEEIQRVQPKGPYRLAGHSLGGIIALAIARHFEQREDIAVQVLLFDTFSPDYLRRSASDSLETNLFSTELPFNEYKVSFDAAKINHRLASSYKLVPMLATIHHFTAMDNNHVVTSGVTWQNAPFAMEFHRVSGGHETMLQAPNVFDLASLTVRLFEEKRTH